MLEVKNVSKQYRGEDKLLFDAGKGRPEGLTQRFADQLRVFTDLLDALKG